MSAPEKPVDDSPITATEVDAYVARRGVSHRVDSILRMRAEGLAWTAIDKALGVSAGRARQVGQKFEHRIQRQRDSRTPHNIARDELDERSGTAGLNAWRILTEATGVGSKDEARALLAEEPAREVPGLSAQYLSALREWVGVPSSADRRRAALAAVPVEPLPEGVIEMRREEVVTVREYWSCTDAEHRHTTRNAAERCVRAAMKEPRKEPTPAEWLDIARAVARHGSYAAAARELGMSAKRVGWTGSWLWLRAGGIRVSHDPAVESAKRIVSSRMRDREKFRAAMGVLIEHAEADMKAHDAAPPG